MEIKPRTRLKHNINKHVKRTMLSDTLWKTAIFADKKKTIVSLIEYANRVLQKSENLVKDFI